MIGGYPDVGVVAETRLLLPLPPAIKYDPVFEAGCMPGGNSVDGDPSGDTLKGEPRADEAG